MRVDAGRSEETTEWVPLIAIMQGRLSPPVNGQLQSFPSNTWPTEFARARDAGLDAIEWIFDAAENPVLTATAVDRIQGLSRETSVGVKSICADYFMDSPLHRARPAEVERRLAILHELVNCAREIGAVHVVLPCVDQSAVVGRTDQDRLVSALGDANPYAESRGVELHLETSLGPREFAELLDRLPFSVKANYDSGNSASLGYDVREEFLAYGERVGSVHIKDRRNAGGSVPLGSGDANFGALFQELDRVRYRGLFTLQVARGVEGHEVELARQNRAFVLRHVEQSAPRR